MIRILRRLLSIPEPVTNPQRKAAKRAAKAAKTPAAKAERSARKKSPSYADRVMDRMNNGKAHASLGPQLKEGSVERAKLMVDRLVSWGMLPSHNVVDFGCGTLRVGAFLIDYLEPGRYFGLDIDRRLLDLGLEMLPAGTADLKRPTLQVISPESIAGIAALGPQWIFSKGVAQHVAPEELGVYFRNISALAGAQTTIVIQVSKLADTTNRISKSTWSHSLDELKAEAEKAGLTVKQSPDPKKRGSKSLILGKA